MSKKITTDETEAILEMVSNFEDGASINDIAQNIELSVSKRTLQRHLASLIQQNKLVAVGEKKGRRYFATTASSPPTESRIEANGIPLSIEGQRLRGIVAQSIQMRKPVGYNRDFLDSYRPNESFYLTPNMRARLATLGRVKDEVLPAGTYVREVYNRLLIDLSWNSSRLEGNTYSLLETERLLEFGEGAEGRSAKEAQMILNHKAAIELLVEQVDEIGFNRYTVMNLHALLSDNLLADPSAYGRLRSRRVGIDGSTFEPLEGPQVIEECFDQIIETAKSINDPFEQAFFAMVHIPYLQPFEDVNKRVSRLVANISLIRDNYCPLSFVDVPGSIYLQGIIAVYELNRIELLRDVFAWAYERSCGRYSAITQSLGEPDPFRLKYREKIRETVQEVVRARLDKRSAVKAISRRGAEEVPSEDRAQFTEIVETELISLHEGNVARYRIRPSEYHAWRETWK